MEKMCERCGKPFQGEGKLCPACREQNMPLKDSDYEDLWRQAKYSEDKGDSQR